MARGIPKLRSRLRDAEGLFYADFDALVRRVSTAVASEEENLRDAVVAYRDLLTVARNLVSDLETVTATLIEAIGDEPLSGHRLSTFAVSVLRQSENGTEPIHYTRWYDLVTAAGGIVRGSDPLATFLTAISRDERVEKAGANRSGLYRLRGGS